jgi:hypothetical protein
MSSNSRFPIDLETLRVVKCAGSAPLTHPGF